VSLSVSEYPQAKHADSVKPVSISGKSSNNFNIIGQRGLADP
jgi:hypothetical protein